MAAAVRCVAQAVRFVCGTRAPQQHPAPLHKWSARCRMVRGSRLHGSHGQLPNSHNQPPKTRYIYVHGHLGPCRWSAWCRRMCVSVWRTSLMGTRGAWACAGALRGSPRHCARLYACPAAVLPAAPCVGLLPLCRPARASAAQCACVCVATVLTPVSFSCWQAC